MFKNGLAHSKELIFPILILSSFLFITCKVMMDVSNKHNLEQTKSIEIQNK